MKPVSKEKYSLNQRSPFGQAAGIPFILPALLITQNYQKGLIDRATGLNWLDRLSAFISDEEYRVAKLLLEGKS